MTYSSNSQKKIRFQKAVTISENSSRRCMGLVMPRWGVQEFLGRVLGKLGFNSCKTSPCIYYNIEFDMKIVAHVDDLLINGRRKDLEWVKAELEEEVEATSDLLSNRQGTSSKSVSWDVLSE